MKFGSILGPAGLLALAALLCLAPFADADDTALPPGDSPEPDVFARLKLAGGASDHEGAGTVKVYDRSLNTVKPSGVTYVDSYIIYKVLTDAGCREMSVLRWNYDPRSSYVEVKDVNLVRGGRRIPVDISGIHDLPAPQRAIYWNDRIKTLQLPRLLPGDGIEIETFRKGFTYALLDQAAAGVQSGAQEAPGDERYVPPMPGEYFDIVLFEEDMPIVEKRYVLSMPAGKRIHSQVYNGPLYSATTYTEERTEYSWWGLDLAKRSSEPGQPDRSDYAAKVVIATVESWEAKSRWFFDVNRDQFEVTEAIRDKVDQIIEQAGVSKGSDREKAEVLLHWVAQNIRYSGQTMGEGEGFTLHPAPMIFEQRSGVCKDIAGMLIAMMRAAGLDSYAAMTMAGSRIEQVPADQFNHCVCALRLEDGTFEMYDPTWVPYNNCIWSLLEAEQDYLVGTPRGEPLDRIAYSPPDESPLVVRHEARLHEDGTLEGRFELAGSGAMDGRLRRMIVYTRKSDLGGMFASLLSAVGRDVEDVDFAYREPDDFSGDMWIEFGYTIPRFALSVSGGLEFNSPAAALILGNSSLFRASATDWKEERRTDVFLYYTQSIDAEEKIRLPRGYVSVDTPSSDTVDETYAFFRAESSSGGSTLSITQNAEIRRRQIPPEGYEGFRRAISEAKEWRGTIFRVEKGGA